MSSVLVYVDGKRRYCAFVSISHSIGGTLVVSKNHCARCHFAEQEIKKKTKFTTYTVGVCFLVRFFSFFFSLTSEAAASICAFDPIACCSTRSLYLQQAAGGSSPHRKEYWHNEAAGLCVWLTKKYHIYIQR